MLAPNQSAIAILRREQELDEARAVAWLLEANDDAKSQVWRAIQKEPADSLEDVVLRFAQLGMTHAILLTLKEAERMEG